MFRYKAFSRGISLAFLLLILNLTVLNSQENQGYQRPNEAIAKLIDAPSTPSVSIDSKANWMLFMESPGYPSIEEVAAPELRIAGTRINPATNGRSRSSHMTGLKLKSIADGKEFAFSGMPAKPQIGNVSWSNDETKIAFTNTTDSGIELWLADIETKSAKKLLGTIVNNAYVSAFEWMPNNSLVVSTVVENRGVAPKKPAAPKGPVLQETTGAMAASRTYQDLLESPYDEELFEYYTTVQLRKVDVNGNATSLGDPAIIKDFNISPDGTLILVQTIQKPFSYLVPGSRFPFNYEVWSSNTGAQMKLMGEIPLDEVRPNGFDATRLGRRSMNWRADRPNTLYWAEAADDGDPKIETDKRDIVYMQAAPFMSAPVKLATTTLRYSSIAWANDDLAILNQQWWASRTDRRTKINPSNPSGEGEVFIDRNTSDRYNDPGNPMYVKNDYGWNVLKMDKDDLFMRSSGGSAEGDRPYLSKFNINTQKEEILFRSEAPNYERTIDIISKKADKIITIRESEKEPPNYFIRDLKKGTFTAITDFPHPQPELIAINKEIIKYNRKDGVDLTAVLYTPAGYDKDKDGPLPVLMWAYPTEYKSAANAAQVRGTPYSFTRVSSGSPIFWVLRGYAVMENTQFPIIGEGDKEPNDTFREQLILNAEAAIDKIVEMGVGDRNKIAVGGHSYGAFMTANLLAHSDLFAAGIARSGAYNRTLTPFGFQREERTYWEDPDLYNYMSPFMHADKVNEPLLMIHGEADNNSGTFPMQSIRFYNAIKGHGGTARLVMLPDESHGYRAKESIMHMLYEMDTWLEKHVKNATTKPEGTEINTKDK